MGLNLSKIFTFNHLCLFLSFWVYFLILSCTSNTYWCINTYTVQRCALRWIPVNMWSYVALFRCVTIRRAPLYCSNSEKYCVKSTAWQSAERCILSACVLILNHLQSQLKDLQKYTNTGAILCHKHVAGDLLWTHVIRSCFFLSASPNLSTQARQKQKKKWHCKHAISRTRSSEFKWRVLVDDENLPKYFG